MPNQLQRVYQKYELPQYCGLQRTQINELIRIGQFPRPLPIYEGGRAIVWLESELVAWQQRLIANRQGETPA